jgi:hypothetical protein
MLLFQGSDGMTRWKRLFYYLLINVLVSACTVWAVLSIWQMTHQTQGSPFNPFAINLSSPTPAALLETLSANRTPQSTGGSSLQTGIPISGTLQTTTITGTTQAAGRGLLVGIVNVFGAGDLPTERVRLECRGQSGVSLAGWQLTDGDGHTYTFPELTLFPGGAVDVHTGPGNNDVVSLYWGLEQPIWSTGRTVKLLDGHGAVQATFVVP